MQLAAVRTNGLSIQYIANPSEEVQLAAVRNVGYAIKYIDNPSESVKLAALHNYRLIHVKADGTVIIGCQTGTIDEWLNVGEEVCESETDLILLPTFKEWLRKLKENK